MNLREAASGPPLATETPAATGRRMGLLLMGLALGVIGTVLVGIAVIGPLVIAKRSDLPLERIYGDVAVSIASRFGAGNQQNPNAQNPRAVSAGRDAYTGSCAMCHGATGDGRGVFGPSSYPNATDLTAHDATEKSDGQMFWIIKNGLSFTGMPGFDNQYSDQDIWSLVSYVRVLQNPSSVPAGRGGGGSGAQPQFGPIDVPVPSIDQLDRADPASRDPVGRGAAVYFALGCQTCHGAIGDAPGNLGLSRGGGPEAVQAIRDGRPGMPAYKQSLVTDPELSDLQAYFATIGSTQRREGGGGEGGGRFPGGAPGR
jgi:mono/diheme cytochrome c family protein